MDTERKPLPDVQNTEDRRNIPIDRVGVKDVKWLLKVPARAGGHQQTVGHVALTVGLPSEFKGTHMSRFLEVLAENAHDLSGETIPAVLESLRDRLNARTAYMTVYFTLFMEKAAPVTGKVGMMGYDVGFEASFDGGNELWLAVTVPITTLCPCSKDISDYGAHNQRGYVRLRVRPTGFLWLEDLIELVERCGSAPLYPVLKRPDEKHVTEQAYENPRFVEDVVREVALALDAHPIVDKYELAVENHESIHDHNAYAYLNR